MSDFIQQCAAKRTPDDGYRLTRFMSTRPNPAPRTDSNSANRSNGSSVSVNNCASELAWWLMACQQGATTVSPRRQEKRLSPIVVSPLPSVMWKMVLAVVR